MNTNMNTGKSTSAGTFQHISVMHKEVMEAMAPKAGEVYVDGTLGGGGYALGLLEMEKCKVYGIDRDPASRAHAADLHENLIPVAGCFGDVRALIPEKVDGFMLDLGVSSVQIDTPARGFSFRHNGPLDMRMDTDADIQTAADIVNTYEEKPLADLIYKYGEERKSRQIAHAIIRARQEEKIETTAQLVEIIHRVIRPRHNDKQDPATRTFQALRIAVNDELGELERALEASVHILKPGGRLVVVSFHSLEDTMVKAFMRAHSGEMPNASRYMPENTNGISHQANQAPLFALKTRKAVFPSEEEIQHNPRARSARLRCAVRTDQAA